MTQPAMIRAVAPEVFVRVTVTGWPYGAGLGVIDTEKAPHVLWARAESARTSGATRRGRNREGVGMGRDMGLGAASETWEAPGRTATAAREFPPPRTT